MPFRLHNVLMRPGFEISGCAEAAVVAPADDVPVISVPSSPRATWSIEDAAPGKDEPMIIPGKGREAMVCVQATRASQTPPLIVPDIHRVLEGTGMFLNALTINWTMVCWTLNVIIVKEHWDLYIDIRP